MILGVSKVKQKGTTPLFSLGILSTNSLVDSACFNLSLKILDGRPLHTPAPRGRPDTVKNQDFN